MRWPAGPPKYGRPDGSTPRIEAFDQLSLRSRIGLLAALVAALAVVLVSAAAFVTVRVNILETLDTNLLQRATAAAQSELADPEQLAQIPTDVLGAGDIRLALLLASGPAISVNFWLCTAIAETTLSVSPSTSTLCPTSRPAVLLTLMAVAPAVAGAASPELDSPSR